MFPHRHAVVPIGSRGEDTPRDVGPDGVVSALDGGVAPWCPRRGSNPYLWRF